MSPRLPRVTGAEIVSSLQRSGVEVVRIKGSDRFLRHPDSRTTVVPVHTGETIGPGLLTKILRDAELSREEFIALI